MGNGSTVPQTTPQNGWDHDALIDLQRFPVLVEDVDRVSSPAGSAGSGGSLETKITGALRDVLGWKAKSTDPKGFLAALSQSFSGTQVDGHVAWKWTPRTYAVQADLGALTGAQASLYSRAKNALDQSIPLLDGLFSLQEDTDPQDMDAVRMLVRSELTELVNEIGVSGGPRVQRVNKLFALLVNDDPSLAPELPQSIDDVCGHLGILRDRFAIVGTNVNTIIEEQNQTNYLILADHVVSLLRSWLDNVKFFDRSGGKAFLGTQLVLLSRDLAVLSESVQEAYTAMNSVFLGAAERETSDLTLVLDTSRQNGSPKSEIRITIGELLRWVDTFATEDGPRILQDGGKDGVELAFRPMLEQLQILVNAAVAQAREKSGMVSEAFRTKRVLFALQQVEVAICMTLDDTRGIRRAPDPTCDLVTLVPDYSNPEGIVLIITGTYFQPGATVTISGADTGADPIVVDRLSVVPSVINASVARTRLDRLTPDGDGMLAILVTNKDGGWDSIRFPWSRTGDSPAPNSPTPVDPPAPSLPPPTSNAEVMSISPAESAERDVDIHFTISGRNFPRGARVSFGEGFEVRNTVTSRDGQQISGILKIPEDADPGPLDIGIYSANGAMVDMKSGMFHVG